MGFLLVPRRWAGPLFVAAGLWSISLADGDVRKVDAGYLFIGIGALLVAWQVRDLFDFRTGPRLKKWERTLDRAVDQARQGDQTAARAQFQQAVQESGPAPRRQRANTEVARVLLHQRRPIEAIPYLRSALTLKERSSKPTDPTLARMRFELAELYLSCGYWPHAGALLEQQISTGVGVPRARALLAETLILAGRNADAKAAVEAAISEASAANGEWSIALCEPLLLRAYIEAGAGDDVAAATTLERALATAERIGEKALAQRARAGLAEVYQREGRAADAADALSKYVSAAAALGTTPLSTVPFLRDQARALIDAGNPDEGRRIQRRAEIIVQAAERGGETPERIAAAGSDHGNWWRRSRPGPSTSPPT
jgi:tetratricopeptide (TPR) repeat protein